MEDWRTQSPFTEEGYGFTLPKDILLLLANKSPRCWYLIAVTNREWARYAKEKMPEKKIAFSIPVLSTWKGKEEYFRLPNMRRHGKYVHSTNGGTRLEGEYVDGEKTGLWKLSGKDWLIEEKNYEKGCLDGVSIKYNNNGGLHIRENYKNGVRHGLYEEWHRNGILAETGHYHKGNRIGKWSQFNLKGEPSE